MKVIRFFCKQTGNKHNGCNNFIDVNCKNQVDAAFKARQQGWLIGWSNNLCPDCARKKYGTESGKRV